MNSLSPTHVYTKDFEHLIVSLIEKFPGLGLHELSKEISREIITSVQSLKYYTDKLLQKGMIWTKKDGKHTRFYVKGFYLSEYEEKLLFCLRKPLLLHMILIFLQYSNRNNVDTIKNQELADRLGVPASTITYNINQLIKCNIVEKTKTGFFLINPIVIEDFIHKYVPTPTLIDNIETKNQSKPSIIDNFISIWKNYFE